jgi:hypothetical protein
VAALVAPAPAGAQKIVVSPPVLHTADIPSNSIVTFTVTCPPGYFAMGGGVVSPAPGVTTLSITPVGARAFRFRFGNPVTNPAGRVTVSVTCRKIGFVPGLKIKPAWLTGTVKSKPVIVPPGQTKKLNLKCPPGEAPSGYGYDESSSAPKYAGAKVPSPIETLDIVRAMPVPGAWSFSLENTWRDSPKSAVLYARCVSRTVQLGGRKEHVQVARMTFHERAKSGENRYSARCQKTFTPLGTGFSLPGKHAAEVVGTGILKTVALWFVDGFKEPFPKLDVYLLCGRVVR